MFAGLNLFRPGAMARMNLKSFEFSQNYLLFWDKLEKANYFLEAILETADRLADERTVHWLLGNLLSDGGQWNMFVNLIHKYGVVPKNAMPETESSSNTARMNAILKEKLREGARTLRDAIAHGATVDEARETKQAFLQVVYRILAIHLGTPPTTVDWQWLDKDRAFHRDGTLTPQELPPDISRCRSTSTSAWYTIRGTPARSAGRLLWSTSAMSGKGADALSQRRDRRPQGHREAHLTRR